MAVTLREVAKLAGVSVRTVSNVVNGFHHVAPQTRARVQEVLDRVGYQPNLMARTLRSGRSGMIALVVPEIDVPYFAELTRSIIGQAEAYGYTVVVDQTDGDAAREREVVLGGARAALFDGLILSPVSITVDDLRQRSGGPVVLLGEQIVDGGFDHIMIDNVAAAYTRRPPICWGWGGGASPPSVIRRGSGTARPPCEPRVICGRSRNGILRRRRICS
ncbi:LacI family DNA-binding transcriptional regulator [Fodinicola feengrottensis]|uniref:LacI family DNA-binding transcriptional regulator n=1 Tax=Fodinicola feengrottensis TaxID=435914 RepID=UPI0024423842|nr:LacI family DNA-binding transcriptional regulator [Fodinicola feengrottensis]